MNESAKHKVYRLLAYLLAEHGEYGVPSTMNYGDGGDVLLKWEGYGDTVIYVTAWTDAPYDITVYHGRITEEISPAEFSDVTTVLREWVALEQAEQEYLCESAAQPSQELLASSSVQWAAL